MWEIRLCSGEHYGLQRDLNDSNAPRDKEMLGAVKGLCVEHVITISVWVLSGYFQLPPTVQMSLDTNI